MLQRKKQTIMNKAARWLEERDGYGKLSWILSMAEKDRGWPGLEHLNSLSSSKCQTGKSPLAQRAGAADPPSFGSQDQLPGLPSPVAF